MPPIPTTLDQETLGLVNNLSRRQKDLESFQIPRLRQCKGPISLQQQYAVELREDLETFARLVENVELQAQDQERKAARLEVERLVDGFRSSCARLKKEMRSALLESKMTIDMQNRSNRDELLRSFAAAKPATDDKSKDDILMGASNDVTEALRRTIGLMQGELERSVLSSQMLESSTSTLRATSATHDNLNSLMNVSKQLITALEKADWIDRLLIFAGFGFFLLVVLFILKQRIFDRGMRLAFWWTRFIPDFSSDEALLNAEKGHQTLSTSAVLSTPSSTLISAGQVVVKAIYEKSEPAVSVEHTLSSLITQEAISSITNAQIPSAVSSILDSFEAHVEL